MEAGLVIGAAVNRERLARAAQRRAERAAEPERGRRARTRSRTAR